MKGWSTKRTAGSWGYLPLEGDGPLNLLSEVEQEPLHSPKMGLFRWFSSIGDVHSRWDAIGVWNAVVDSPYKEWAELFEEQAPLVRQMAKSLLEDPEWIDGWDDKEKTLRAVRIYANGGRVNYSDRFHPKNSWKILNGGVEFEDGSQLRLILQLENRETGEKKFATETVEKPTAWAVDYGVDVREPFPGDDFVYVTAVQEPLDTDEGLGAEEDGEGLLKRAPRRDPIRSHVKLKSYDGSLMDLEQGPWTGYDPSKSTEQTL